MQKDNTKQIVYLNAEEMTQINGDKMILKEICQVTCNNQKLLSNVEQIKVGEFTHGKSQRVIQITDIINCIHNGYPDAEIVNLGSNFIIVRRQKPEKKKWILWSQISLVALLIFFGSAFTIMAFHNDIGIRDIFAEVYELITGNPSNGATILEASYSVGLLLGIILFFHHFGRKKERLDPTPVEVSMRTYEKEVNAAIVEQEERLTE